MRTSLRGCGDAMAAASLPSSRRVVGWALLMMLVGVVLGGSALYAATQEGVAQASGERPGVYRISGVAVNGTTGEAIPRCHMNATPSPTSERGGGPRAGSDDAVSADADAQGHFSLNVPRAGHWRLVGSARGFRPQAYEEHEGYSSAIVLSAGAPTIELNFKLTPNVTIEGTVLDEAGEPVRAAMVSLLYLPPPSPDEGVRPPEHRGTKMTDDRGHYEFFDAMPGAYTLSVQAQPWYATLLRQEPGEKSAGNSLDVAYPLTWYPGVTEYRLAVPLEVQGGESRQADFHLLPVAAYRLRLPPAANETGSHNMGAPGISYITQFGADGSEHQVGLSMNRTAGGDWEIGGLATGTYQVVRPDAGGNVTQSSLLEIRPGSEHALDLSATEPVADVSVVVDDGDAVAGVGRNAQITLIDMATGHANFVTQQINDMRSRLRSRVRAAGALNDGGSAVDRTMHTQLLPGRYEVVLHEGGERYLTGITATGAEARGRLVELHSGEARLVLHVASGRRDVRGMVRQKGQPTVGATVLLVPATLGNENGLTMLRRDQTNSDGSFELDGVIPGAYILVAIDRGWTVNWKDATTLRRYLLGGVAVDLTRTAAVERDLEAQAP